MNAIAPSPDLTVLEAPSAACPSSPGIEDQPAANQLHRKIAKLPNPLRDLINSMLDDNLPASQIIAKLQASTDPPLPYPISEVNISDWKKTGYQRYLAQQERLAYDRANREAALDMVADNDTTTLPEATLQIIASQYYDLLGDFSPIALKQKLAEDPLKYTRFLNVFARLTREIVVLKKHREACAKNAAAKLQELDDDRDLSNNEHGLVVNKMDRIFKIRRRRPVETHSRSAGILPAGTAGILPAVAQTPVGPLPSAGAPESSAQKPVSNTPPLQDPITPPPVEHCLECRAQLPPLLPNGERPADVCDHCGVMLLRPGIYWKPSLDRCLDCGTALPHPLPTGERLVQHCHKCGVTLHRYEPPSDIPNLNLSPNPPTEGPPPQPPPAPNPP